MNAESAAALEIDFDEFWALSTKKRDKGHARIAYRRARRQAAKAEIHDAYRRYGIETSGTNPKYIAHPATWLRGERWTDEADRKPIADRRLLEHRDALVRAALARDAGDC